VCVVMMHRDRMKPKYSLEDYIYEMECRSVEPSVDPENLDVYAQLQQKEKDLILAAKLGKALLEKNEELSRQNEKIAEDYSQKLEVSNEALLHLLTKVMHGSGVPRGGRGWGVQTPTPRNSEVLTKLHLIAN